MISFIRNGCNDIWVAFDPDSGKTIAVVRKMVWAEGYGIYYGRTLQGLHPTLEAAKGAVIAENT